MGRQEYKYTETNLIGGINQAAEVANLSECADARNVWAPRGKLEQRPGYVGRYVLMDEDLNTDTPSNVISIKETPIDTFSVTTTLSNLPVNSRWYLVFTTTNVDRHTAGGVGLLIGMNTTNANSMRMFAEYHNGTDWVYLDTRETSSYLHIAHLSNASSYCFFVWPRDLGLFDTSTLTAGGITTGYGVRFTLQAVDGSLAFDASTQLQLGNLRLLTQNINFTTSPTLAAPTGLFAACRFKTGTRYLVNTCSTGRVTFNLGQLTGPISATEISTSSLGPLNQPPTIAVVTDTDEAFVASGGTVTRHLAVPTTDITASVETADFAVGPTAPYDKNYIGQRSDFPVAKYITYFQNRIWYATDTTVGWGAPLPYHKVFPLLSEESFADEDNSIVTGMSSLGENLIVFKERSIWMMVLDSINAFGLAVFRRRKIISGVGCVSNASIQRINGELIFQAERGLYAFNGQTIRKVTLKNGQDRLRDFFGASVIDRTRCVSVDWRKYGCYLLALTSNTVQATGTGAFNSNTLVLVWDYEHDAFWFWDDIFVQQWLNIVDSNGEERLHFVDPYSRIFEMESSNYDHGAAITSYVVTQRMGLDSGNTKSLRAVNITATNTSSALSVDCLPDDAVSAPIGGSGTIAFTDFNEKEYSTAVYDTDSYTEERRRQNRLMFHLNGQYFQIKLSHSTKNTPWALTSLRVGFEPLGIR